MSARLGPLFNRLKSSEPPTERPFVTLTYAQSLDGSIARERGKPLQLSGPESMAMTHRLRARHDAILIGIGTLLADDPQLTVRHAAGGDPQPVVLDTRLRTPPQSQLMQSGHQPWIAHGPGAPMERAELLGSLGATLLNVAEDERGCVELEGFLGKLRSLGISRLMVEGGAAVITSFLTHRLVDLLVVTVSPRLVGGYRAVQAGDLPAWLLIEPKWTSVGRDMVVWGNLSEETR